MGIISESRLEVYSESLLWAAQHALNSGYSVIPVHADSASERAKVAAVNWKCYQYRRPSQVDLHQWFEVDKHRGLAIVTGTISNLIVLDFDDAGLAQHFANRCAHLLETYTVRSATRGLPHYYFRIPVGEHIPTQKRYGVDLLSNGCYVLAPPTDIGDNAYCVTRGGSPRVLTNAEIGLILRFMDEQRDNTAESTEQSQNRAMRPVEIVDIQPPSIAAIYSANDLIGLYRHLAPLMGRNEALFHVSIRARDAGWDRQSVIDTLAIVHIEQPSNTGHEELPKQRLHEALRTLASAFSRPAKQTPVQQKTPVQLPTSTREMLLNLGQTYTLRVLEGLYLRGLAPGSIFTEKQARDLLTGVVGRYSLLNALNAQTRDGAFIFMRLNSVHPSPRPPTPTHVAIQKQNPTNNKCLIVNVPKPDKNRHGRPPKHYLLPTIAELCALLGIEMHGSDRIEQSDLTSAKDYRQAIHREFLRRRPGLYSRKWLAHRLGVSIRTCQRYNIEMSVGVRPMYRETSITWANLQAIPDDFVPDGAFIEDRRGKRYPVNRGIAAKLLARDRYILYKRRDVNYYWYGETPSVASITLGIRPDLLEIQTREEKKQAFVQKNLKRAVQQFEQRMQIHTVPRPSDPTQPPIVPKPKPPPPQIISKRYIPKRKSYYRQPLPDATQEAVALRAYRLLAQLGTADSGRMSKARARRLVEEYGTQIVTDALKILGARRNVRNPAGFLVTLVRSESNQRKLNPALMS